MTIQEKLDQLTREELTNRFLPEAGFSIIEFPDIEVSHILLDQPELTNES